MNGTLLRDAQVEKALIKREKISEVSEDPRKGERAGGHHRATYSHDERRKKDDNIIQVNRALQGRKQLQRLLTVHT